MRLVPIVLALLVVTPVPVAASGGIGCEAKDQNLAFDTQIGTTRGSGGFYSIRTALDVALPGIPDDLRKLTLENALLHSWVDGDEIKLHFYVEREEGPFASLDFVVETTMVEEGDYRGGYVLTVYEAQDDMDPDLGRWTAEGSIDCMAE
jgi:hypothetical protein